MQISKECEQELRKVLRHNIENHRGHTIEPFELWGLDSNEESREATAVADAYDFQQGKEPILEWLMRAVEMGVHPLTIFAWYFTSVLEARDA